MRHLNGIPPKRGEGDLKDKVDTAVSDIYIFFNFVINMFSKIGNKLENFTKDLEPFPFF